MILFMAQLGHLARGYGLIILYTILRLQGSRRLWPFLGVNQNEFIRAEEQPHIGSDKHHLYALELKIFLFETEVGLRD